MTNDRAVEAARKALERMGFDAQPQEIENVVEAAAPHIERAFVDRLTDEALTVSSEFDFDHLCRRLKGMIP